MSTVRFKNSPLGITANKLNKLRDDIYDAIAAGGGGTPSSGVSIYGEIPTG